MRIGYLCADRGVALGGTKGASIHVESVARALSNRNHQLHLLVSRVDRMPSGFPMAVTEVGFDRTLKELRESMGGRGGVNTLSREIYSLLVNTRTTEALESLHHRWALDALYERYSLWSWAGLRFCREHKIPFVVEVNAPLVEEQHTYRELELDAVAQGLEAMILKQADAIVVPSDELADYVESRRGSGKSIFVLPNGVDLELFDDPPALPRREARRFRDRFTAAFVGSLKPWHGVGHLLSAFARLTESAPKAQLLFLGDGPMRSEVEDATRRFGAERVAFIGSVPHEEVPSWLAHADVGVAPYPDLDHFYFSPMKVVEYLAAGLPVVASRIGQNAQLVEHERCGLLVTPGNESELAGALLRLYREPRERARMARRAHKRAIRRHGWNVVAEKIEEIFAENGRRAKKSCSTVKRAS